MREVQQLNFPASPPPPPPPPPPPLVSSLIQPLQESKLSPKSFSGTSFSMVNKNELNLAVDKLLSFDPKFSRIFYLTGTDLMPQLQNGPKCGLVALSIATSGSGNFVAVEDIFEFAVLHGFTKQGEIFDANSLAALAQKCGFKTHILKGGLHTHLNCILKSLLRKCLLLVPYDADFNHAPCCKNGEKAHWAVIFGFVIFERANTDSHIEDDAFVSISSSESPALCDCMCRNNTLPLTVSLHQRKILIGKSPITEFDRKLKEGEIYLFGLQGKSKHIGLWPFNKICDSNSNLNSFSSSRNPDCYVLPSGGIKEGLNGKAIILHHFDLF